MTRPPSPRIAEDALFSRLQREGDPRPAAPPRIAAARRDVEALRASDARRPAELRDGAARPAGAGRRTLRNITRKRGKNSTAKPEHGGSE
jgi:hypothetical protein